MTAKPCTHPKDSRSLLHGYDVICNACGEMIGRVALFPCVVLTADEARTTAAALFLHIPVSVHLPTAARTALAKMEAVR